MYSVEGITVEFGGFTLLDHISFVIDKKDRIALVGKNGAGKSTLLKIIAGIKEPSSGKISMPKEITIGYLPQQMNLFDTRSVFEEACLAFQHVFDLEREVDKVSLLLSERVDYESVEYQKLIDKLSLLNEQLVLYGSENYKAEVEKVLLGLGFTREDFDRPTNTFSGGWRMRIELAKILLKKPDILLLDEPTNHLDIESIQWLESFLMTQAKALLLVSHDKAFIDNTTTRTIEISLGKIYDYKVNYSKYIELRKERREQQLRAYENQRKQIEDTEAFIERFRYKATKSVQVQSRIKQLQKIERIEVDEEDTSALRLKFPPSPRSGSYPVVMEGLEKKYGEHVVFSNVTLTIERGDKVAFVGKNGEGKSTLVKCIMGEIPYEGKLKLGHNVKIGYFAQNQAMLMDENLTVFETIDNVAVGDIRTKVRDLLGSFMFGGDSIDKKVGVLSGGERTRLSMIKLLLEPVNLLILDEPTNHLDMKSKEVLKQAIKDFDGTAIIVSHDRDFLDGLVEKVYEFGNKQVKENLGGIYDFLEKKKMENLNELEIRKSVSLSAEKNISKKETEKISYEGQKELQKQKDRKRIEKTIKEKEKEIDEIEKKIKSVEEKLSLAESSSDSSLIYEHADLNKRYEKAMDEWTIASQSLEKI